jgi:hypothetical protein
MEKEGEMIPKVIPKLGKDSKVREPPPSQMSNHFMSFPKEGVPPLFM